MIMVVRKEVKMTIFPKHGSPHDRGSADAYYGRRFDPHWYPNGSYNGERIEKSEMTPEEIAEYTYGYENQTDRKDWG